MFLENPFSFRNVKREKRFEVKKTYNNRPKIRVLKLKRKVE